jgi:CheY-like chemotaxis protein
MKNILIIEDDPEVLKKLLDIFLPQKKGEPFEPEFSLTICTTEEAAKEIDPGTFNYILIDHDLPNRGNGGRVLNYWVSCYEAIGVVKDGKKEKIIAISSVPVNNDRLMGLGADIAIEKCRPDFAELLKNEMGIEIES